MISVLNRLLRLSGSRRVLFFFGLVFGLLIANAQAQDPSEDYRTHFLIHKVRKGDTSFSLTKRYEISAQQLLYYNPELKDGLKRKMKLKIRGIKRFHPHQNQNPKPIPTQSKKGKRLGVWLINMGLPSKSSKRQIQTWMPSYRLIKC